MEKHKIVFTDYYYPNNNTERRILEQLESVEIVDCTKLVDGGIRDEDSVLQYGADADALIVQFSQISRKVIEGLSKCRIISRYAIGVDNIDVAAAKEKGVVVANVPDYCVEEVSDTAVAHMLNCIRKLSLANDLVHRGDWTYERVRPLFRFAEMTVGLIAFGHIARRVAEKLKPYGNRIVAYDPIFKDQQSYDWVDFLSFEEVLREADVLSVHAPLNKDTRHLIDHDQFSVMKNGVILVNTSRGGLINEEALIDAVEKGTVALAGLDVLDCADTEYGASALLRFPDRVFITPHMGWYSQESVQDLQRKTALNVYEMFTKGKPLYSV
jgi:D-3-phosphoglycerate dehydrogenase